MASGPTTSWQIERGKVEAVIVLFSWAPKSLWTVTIAEKLKDACLLGGELNLDGEKMERVTDFIFLGSKITVDGDCSLEIKRCLLLGRKDMTNLEGMLKSRDITLPTKVLLVKAMVFPVVIHGCESWTIKKAEQGRIYAFEL